MKERRYLLGQLKRARERHRRRGWPLDRAAADVYTEALTRVEAGDDCRDVADDLALRAGSAAYDGSLSRDEREGRATAYATAAEFCRNAYGGG